MEKRKSAKNETVEVNLTLDKSLARWAKNSSFSVRREKHFNSNARNISSIYCEVVRNGDCHECQAKDRKWRSAWSSMERFPDLQTGGYLLFQSLSKKHKVPERTTYSALSFISGPAAPESRYSSLASVGSLRGRVRSASAILSDINREAKGSARVNSQARPYTSTTVPCETNLRTRATSFISRGNARKISPMSQEGWSEKQIEAWKLLAPTPPQIEVSQMNVSMYTPKELPGIKIFDESLFVI